MIFNVRIYGIEESLVASGYPKQAEIKDWGSEPMAAGVRGLDRMHKLAHTPIGSGHDCALKGMIVQADFHMSQGWWMQAERYHWFDIVSSQSKEHNCWELFGIKDPDEVKIGDKLTARVSTNYLQLKTMYAQRKNHRRTEWKKFCKWVGSLPFSHWITGDK